MFWAFIALMGTIGLAILSLLLWPLRLLLKRLKGTPPTEKDQPAADATAQSADATTKAP
jgi:hypothetical protein